MTFQKRKLTWLVIVAVLAVALYGGAVVWALLDVLLAARAAQ